jgi:hypothetical protein
LTQRSIPFCQIRQGGDLREVLSNFAVQSNFQEFYPWQEQLSTPSI